MASHTYECRICGRDDELHRSVSACSSCRDKYSIPDGEPTHIEIFYFVLKLLIFPLAFIIIYILI